MNELKNKTAVITGSTSGIGKGIAHQLSDQGANIVLNGFGDEDEIESLRKDIESKGVKCFYHGADMTKPEEIKDLIEDADKEMQGIDILVNNAGIQYVCSIENYPPETWDKIIAINLSAVFHTTKYVIPVMKRKKWGRIVNIASAHGIVASPFKGAYIAAKHGVVGFTKTTALEVAEDGITANAICPGYVKTPLVENQIADTARERGMTEEEVVRDVMLRAQWTKKFVTIEQVSGLAGFLCSDFAENITGTSQIIDGGWTAA